MERDKKKLPIGIEDFRELRVKNYYYVDKTGLIRQLCENPAKVTLFTRPRRFGKSLNMSMMENFFETGTDKSIFDGLEISKDAGLCSEHMGRYPVISLSLKDIDCLTYERAVRMAADLIANVADRFDFLLESENLSSQNKDDYSKLLNTDMEEATLCGSLKLLCRLLEKHYGRKTVLLIDEYDVPLAKAHAYGYYDRMLSVIRSLLGSALKTNRSLEFAVLTGCLRISKESIFTGLTNLKVRSISDSDFDEYFGFTDKEVREILSYYGCDSSFEAAKAWYDGYRFGKTNVYCPWDVINYCDLLKGDPDAEPENYWINTGDSHAVRKFIEMADAATKQELETLVAGGAVKKEIREDLTYSEIYENIDNLWSLLYATGYLTSRDEGRADLRDSCGRAADVDESCERRVCLAIPNSEVRDVYVKQILTWVNESVRSDIVTAGSFCDALTDGDDKTVEALFNKYLQDIISIRDSGGRQTLKENFYHGMLLGIMSSGGRMSAVLSNREAGNGYADILAKEKSSVTGRAPGTETGVGIIIEVKYAADGNLDAACADALSQIEQKDYTDTDIFKYPKTDKIYKYGIACYKKCCRVMKA